MASPVMASPVIASPVIASTVKVGISVHDSLMVADPARRRALLTRIERAGLDYVCVGDHVSFHDGTGFDGLTAATAALCEGRLPVLVGVYLLALRHPMLTARRLASISQLAPGRLTLGAGVAGEDRSEVSNSGVDPATRGRRMDECLDVLRALAGGQAVDHAGEFFQLSSARIKPAPDPPVPIVIGGKGEAAVRRAARYGDGWLAIFCSARRFAQSADRRGGGGPRPARAALVRHQRVVRAGRRRRAGQAPAGQPARGLVPSPVRKIRTADAGRPSGPGGGGPCPLPYGGCRLHHAGARGGLA